MKVRIGTRGSKLALRQAEEISEKLRHIHCGLETELVVIKTTGDKVLDAPLARIGSKGVFVKEIEEALLEGRIDLAVHSMKDLPGKLPEGLIVGAVPEREDPRDVLISRDGLPFEALPEEGRVGTSSLRRR
ncbi:MAG TPA: hydroxymethylbilane synthase, partial [Deltaproteobacteria bacterium]|nr:hydroxymethylbilane synthase [Deltaproteobacteria bacterium]